MQQLRTQLERLKKIDDEWRIDDIYIRPAPKDDQGTEGGVEGGLPED